MDLLRQALETQPFFLVALVLSLLFGYGGFVHLANILGRGEYAWPDVPLRFKVADVVWGALDFAAMIGTLLRSPIGPICLVAAAVSQILAYGLFPRYFALRPDHLRVLRGMVFFHVALLTVLGISLLIALRTGTG